MASPQARHAATVLPSPSAGVVSTAPQGTPSCLPCAAAPGSLWRNGACDGFGAIGSYERTTGAVPALLAADDFWIAPSCGLATLSTVRVHMALLPLDQPPTRGRLDFYRDGGEQPLAGPPLHTLEWTATPTVVGCIRSGPFLFRVHELAIATPGITLPAGRAWLSPVGWNTTGNEFFLFATAGDGNQRLGQGVWHNLASSPEPWNPISAFPGFEDRRGDFGFEVDGTCEGLLADGFEAADLRAWTPSLLR
jgi:hypothetical protein